MKKYLLGSLAITTAIIASFAFTKPSKQDANWFRPQSGSYVFVNYGSEPSISCLGDAQECARGYNASSQNTTYPGTAPDQTRLKD